jgi:6-phosphogluconate dehydrogenase
MQLGLVGLGKMGGNMRERIRRAGHEVVGYDRNQEVSDARTLADMVKKLDTPRVVWVMVPHGAPTRETVVRLADLLDKGDLVIDGGNSRFTDDAEHERLLKDKGIGYLDCGVSGGIWGLDNGYGLMVGGSAANVRRAMPIFDALRPEGPRDEGFVHAGKVGAGHYTKMVHNGIEYGLMHAYAEGYELLEKKDIVENVPGAFKAWSRGTVVRSWLLDLMVKALEDNPGLEDVSDYTTDSGEGRWTVEEALELSVPMPVISASLFARFASRQQSSPTMQAVAALRGEFGGHQVMTVSEGDSLRAEAVAGPKTADAARKKAARKETPTRSAEKAAAKGRRAASAGPSSGGGATSPSGSRGPDAASAGPTSGTGSTSGTRSTRKRAAAKG